MNVYFDNAATTQTDDDVLEYSKSIINMYYGNPSSIHLEGRKTKVLIEESRNIIAKLLHANPSEIIFTSSATEAINIGILGFVLKNKEVQNVIVSPLEHYAVLNTINFLKRYFNINVDYLNIDTNGEPDVNHIEELLSCKPKSLLCLMHANNETGSLIPLKDITNVCLKNNAFLFCDTVQTIAKYDIDFQKSNISMAAGSAHKFHGIKGIGFLFKSDNILIERIINGGAQERNIRSGTENTLGIATMAQTMQIAFDNLKHNQDYIASLKRYFVSKLNENFEHHIEFNANSDNKGLYNIVNVSFKVSINNETFLELLDINNVAASSGSACSSGSNKKSHVIDILRKGDNYPTVRFSFSKYNTVDEIDYVIETLKKIIAKFPIT
ncbi:MAG: hypothetical protein A2X12_03445 [Bacteroidetes bacterium GWE2_29_8]|nr:MAG: hypothetical protein A2X12_03445 [Bacteroidetes bacterium GWE2_29_8]OFY17391.1 MAG: hypothetical protein A2X02_00655 [Bacteroidetes bacterium GWF2_29_10]